MTKNPRKKSVDFHFLKVLVKLFQKLARGRYILFKELKSHGYLLSLLKKLRKTSLSATPKTYITAGWYHLLHMWCTCTIDF